MTCVPRFCHGELFALQKHTGLGVDSVSHQTGVNFQFILSSILMLFDIFISQIFCSLLVSMLVFSVQRHKK